LIIVKSFISSAAESSISFAITSVYVDTMIVLHHYHLYFVVINTCVSPQ
jgi:hypothetical protein